MSKFDRKSCAEDGIRYPGDGGPNLQVGIDHESDEEEEDPEVDRQRGEHVPKNKPSRPRDPEKRRLAARKRGEEG